VANRVTWCGGHASVACSAIIIERPLDATQYFNHTGSGRESARYPGTAPQWQTLLTRFLPSCTPPIEGVCKIVEDVNRA
jgi:hypothetical protein